MHRRALANGEGARAGRGAVVALGDCVGARGRRILAISPGLALAGGAEVLVVGRCFLQLAQVHRVRGFRAVGQVGDLPLGARRAHRHRVLAVGHRVRAQGDAVACRGRGKVAQRRGVEPAGGCRAAHRRGVIARSHGRDQAPERTAHGHRVVAAGHGARANRSGIKIVGPGAKAHGSGAVPGGFRAVAQCGAAKCRRGGIAAKGRRTVTRGFAAESVGRRLQARRRRLESGGAAVGAFGGGIATGRRRADPGGLGAVADRDARLACRFGKCAKCHRLLSARHRPGANGDRVRSRGAGRARDRALIKQPRGQRHAGLIAAHFHRLGKRQGRDRAKQQGADGQDRKPSTQPACSALRRSARAVAGGELGSHDQLPQRAVPDLAMDPIHGDVLAQKRLERRNPPAATATRVT